MAKGGHRALPWPHLPLLPGPDPDQAGEQRDEALGAGTLESEVSHHFHLTLQVSH